MKIRHVFLRLSSALKGILALVLEPVIVLIRYVLAKVSREPESVVDAIKQRALVDSAEFIEANLEHALLFESKTALWDYALGIRPTLGLNVELGVFKGHSLNHFAKRVPGETFYGFDSFGGLPDSWSGTSLVAGSFDLQGKKPKVRSNVRLFQGLFQDTLPLFVESQPQNISLMHFDADTYLSTKYALGVFKSKIVAGSLLIFDEYHGYPNWRNGEFRAWAEFVGENDLSFRYLGFTHQQALILIV
jgi:hypothetical protein